MPTPLYNYIPIYGVEEHLPDLPAPGGNGGARADNDNLIITAWEVDTKNGGSSATPFVFGDLIIPRYASDGVSDEEKPAWTTPMLGRVGARFFLSTINDPGFDTYLVLVLAPPQELKQQLAGSVVFNGGDPLSVSSYTFSKSQVGQFAWKGLMYEANFESADGMGGFDSELFNYQIGSYINLNLLGSPEGTYLPLLKTNGANGVAPEAFNMTTADGVAECITAINQGSFFIPMVLEEAEFDTPNSGAYFDVWWPHSGVRG